MPCVRPTDLWREKRGGRLVGHQEAGEGELFTLLRVRTTWASLLRKAAEDSYQAEHIVLTQSLWPVLCKSSEAKKKGKISVNELYKLELLGSLSLIKIQSLNMKTCTVGTTVIKLDFCRTASFMFAQERLFFIQYFFRFSKDMVQKIEIIAILPAVIILDASPV